MPAVLFLHLEVETKYLTAKGPRPSWAFKRKPIRVLSKSVTFYSLSIWTTLFSPLWFLKLGARMDFPCKISRILSVRCNVPTRHAWGLLTRLYQFAHLSPTGLDATEQAHTGKSWFFLSESLGASILWVLIDQEPIWLNCSKGTFHIRWTNWRFVVLHMKFSISCKTRFYSFPSSSQGGLVYLGKYLPYGLSPSFRSHFLELHFLR